MTFKISMKAKGVMVHIETEKPNDATAIAASITGVLRLLGYKVDWEVLPP